MNVLMLIIIPYTLIIGAWHIRNGNLTGAYVFTDNEGALLLPYKAAAILAYKSGRSAEEEYEAIRQTLPEHYFSLDEKLRYEKEEGFEIIMTNKLDYLMLSLKNLPQFLLSPGYDELQIFGGKSRGFTEIPKGTVNLNWLQQIESKIGYKLWYLFLMGVLGAYLLTIYGFFIYGIIASWSTSQYVAFHLLVLGIMLFYIIVSSGNSFSYSRLRAPLMPFFILYASNGIAILWATICNSIYVSKRPIFKQLLQKTHYS